MRHGAFVLAASFLALPAVLTAQDYSTTNQRSTSTVLRPAETVAWRNYVTVPDGPCGCAMSVQADCYNDCPHRCFLKRVGRMLDCLIPCNLCCRPGACGLIHGGHLGKCNICCGVACSGCDGGATCSSHAGCCPNPCGSAFAGVAPSCTSGGHCTSCCTPSCSSALPVLSDPFVDDPPLPKPTSEPATEVRRAPGSRIKPAASQAAKSPAPAPRSTPDKVAKAPTKPSPAAKPVAQASVPAPPAASPARSTPGQSVLRRTSAEQESVEPKPLFIDRTSATPISRSLAKTSKAIHYAVPNNPLR